MREWAQIAGGVLLTLVLIVYGIRLLPFVTGDPSQLPRAEGRVVGKATESLSGSTRPSAQTYLVTIEVDRPAMRTEARLGQDDHAALEVGDSVDMVVHHGQVMALADLRWHPPYRSRFWLIAGAATLFGLETLRRLVRQWRRISGDPPGDQHNEPAGP